MRGKPSELTSGEIIDRITPAGAGKTGCNRHKLKDKWDHPRRCGENLSGFHKDSLLIGSPPQVRGKQTYMGYSFFNNRITPAGAGKTETTSMIDRFPRDHPRRCGENAEKPVTVSMYSGSPPQVRGKH